MKKIEKILCLIFLMGQLTLIAQTSIVGKVTDGETGEEMIGANVLVLKNGVFVQGQSTDIDGKFEIRVESGVYDLEFSYTGFETQRVVNVSTRKGYSTKVNIQMSIGRFRVSSCGASVGWLIPLIRQDETTSKQEITNEQIRQQPTRSIKEISLSAPGVSFSQ